MLTASSTRSIVSRGEERPAVVDDVRAETISMSSPAPEGRARRVCAVLGEAVRDQPWTPV